MSNKNSFLLFSLGVVMKLSLISIEYKEGQMILVLDFWGTKGTLTFTLPESIKATIKENG